jgi:hypothetical protein
MMVRGIRQCGDNAIKKYYPKSFRLIPLKEKDEKNHG